MHKHKYPKKDNQAKKDHGAELIARYIPFVLCWVLFALAVGISLS
ncbi:hypothetical protein [Morganella psychrotolerans]|nr:hypothetical protein [Morganella psychrotolerans]